VDRWWAIAFFFIQIRTLRLYFYSYDAKHIVIEDAVLGLASGESY